MIYQYDCPQCSFTTDIIKGVSLYNSEERCPSCQEVMFKVICSPTFHCDKSWPEFNPAFGKVIKNKYHRDQEAKKRGWIEIGNENPEKMSKTFAQVREEKRLKNWNEV